MSYFVYAIHNGRHDKIYIGQTQDLERRIFEHNNKFAKHNFTARFDGGWSVIYREEVPSLKEALQRERQLKSFQGRQFIKQFNIPR